MLLIERDSFSAIQWGSGKASYPWRLADWAEEVQYISSWLNCKFIHVLTNEDDDVLARERSAL